MKGHTKANAARAKVACGTSSRSKDLGAARAGEGTEKVRGRKETGFLKIVFLLFFLFIIQFFLFILHPDHSVSPPFLLFLLPTSPLPLLNPLKYIKKSECVEARALVQRLKALVVLLQNQNSAPCPHIGWPRGTDDPSGFHRHLCACGRHSCIDIHLYMNKKYISTFINVNNK